MKAHHPLAIALGVAFIGLGWGWSALAADAAQLERGKAKYEYWCATCHAGDPREGGRYLPGTASLMAKYNGQLPGALEDRKDLLPPFVKYVIRRGSEGMPFFRKTEISDSEMEDIAAYLSRNTPQ